MMGMKFYLTLLWFVLAPVLAYAQDPVVQIYYVPVPENDMATNFGNIDSDATNNTTDLINSYISVNARSAGTKVIYDHWEDGYEIDISNPSQSTTEVLTLSAGQVQIYQNQIDPTTYATDITTMDYDGRDKIGATKGVSVSRMGWPTDTDILTKMAGAVEVVPTFYWGTNYTLPVGEDTANGSNAFELTDISIIASEDGTTINIDYNSGATNPAPITLNEGESFFVNSFASGITVNEGATVTADKAIHVSVLSADANTTWEGRWFALLDDSKWDTTYYSPVDSDTGDETRIFVYNPVVNGTVSVNIDHPTASIGSLSIPSGESRSFVMPNTGGAKVSSTTGNIYAVALIDHPDVIADWGYSLVPEKVLTTKFLMGFADGRDPTAPAADDTNTGPIWVTAADATHIYVDWDNDGSPDAVDTNGDGSANITAGNGISLVAYGNTKLFKPGDHDQTGGFVYSKVAATNADVNTGTDGALIAGAWGQDPDLAASGDLSFDAGIGVLPVPQFGGGKNITLENDNDGDGRLSPGDDIRFTVTIFNQGTKELDLHVLDDLDPIIVYIPNSTELDKDGTTVAVPDDVSGTPFPLDVGGAFISSTNIPLDTEWTLTFLANIPDLASNCGKTVTNEAFITADGVTVKTNKAKQIADCTVIGLAERAVLVSPNAGPLRQFKLIYRVENMGYNSINKVRVTNDLSTVINDGATFTVLSVTSPGTHPDPGYVKLDVNPMYDGDSDVELLEIPTAMKPNGQILKVTDPGLATQVREFGIIEVLYRIDLMGADRSYLDNSEAFGVIEGGSASYTDISTNGDDPNPDGDTSRDPTPDPTNNSVPTPVTFGILPVEFVYLELDQQDCGILVEWATATESNNSHFILQRSRNGNNWIDLDRIEGAGNSQQFLTYTYLDAAPGASILYYRVKQVDFDGQFDYSDVKVIQLQNCFENRLVEVLYGNGSGKPQLVFEAGDIHDALVYISSTDGKLVWSGQIDNLLTGKNYVPLELNGLSSGIYFIYAVADGWKSNTIKYMKR